MAFIRVKTTHGSAMLINTEHICRIVRDTGGSIVCFGTGESFRFDNAETQKILDAIGASCF